MTGHIPIARFLGVLFQQVMCALRNTVGASWYVPWEQTPGLSRAGHCDYTVCLAYTLMEICRRIPNRASLFSGNTHFACTSRASLHERHAELCLLLERCTDYPMPIARSAHQSTALAAQGWNTAEHLQKICKSNFV